MQARLESCDSREYDFCDATRVGKRLVMYPKR